MKKAIGFVVVVILGLSLNSCIITCGCSGGPPDTNLDVIVRNTAGEDMLNTATKGSFSKDDFGFFYIEDGNRINVPTSDIDIRTGVQWDASSFDYRLYRASFNLEYNRKSDDRIVTLLTFKDIRTDTLTCFYTGKAISEVKVNGKTVWNVMSQKYRNIEIVIDR